MTGAEGRSTSLVGLYTALLSAHPLVTTMVTTGVMNAIGDATAQALERRKHYDVRRTLLLVVWGILVYAPVALLWYAFLEAAFPGSEWQQVVAKVTLDQTVWAAGCISALFSFSSLTRGETPGATREKVRRDLGPTLKVNWMVWPAVQVLNMALVAPTFRIVVILIVQVPWTAYLALQAAAGSGGGGGGGGRGEYGVLEEGDLSAGDDNDDNDDDDDDDRRRRTPSVAKSLVQRP